jgi:hypothetical protein
VCSSDLGADEFASVADCWSAGFWQPPSKKREPKAHRDKAARLRFIHNLQWEWAIKDYYERRTNQCTGAESHTVVIFCRGTNEEELNPKGKNKCKKTLKSRRIGSIRLSAREKTAPA